MTRPPLVPRLVLRASLRRLGRHKLRSALIVVTTALGVAAMIGTLCVNDQVFGALSAVREHLRSAAPLSVEGISGGVPRKAAAAFLGVPGIQAAVPVSTAAVPFDGRDGSLFILGIDPGDRERFLSGVRAQPEVALDPRLLLAPSGWLLLDREGARQLGLQTGSEVRLLSPEGSRTIMVAGTFDAGKLRELVGGLVAVALPALVEQLKGQPGTADRIELFLEPEASAEVVLEHARRAAPPGCMVERGDSPIQGAESGFAAMIPGLLLAAMTSIIAGAFVVHSVHAISLEERRPEIAVLRALGASRRQILVPLLLEGCVLGALGSVCGVPLGAGIANGAVRALRGNLPLLGLPGNPEVALPGAWAITFAFILGIGATLAAVLALALPVSNEAPALNLRRQIGRRPQAPSWPGKMLLSGFVVLLILVSVFPLPKGGAGYALIGVVGIAFGLLGPLFVRGLVLPLANLLSRKLIPRLALQALAREPNRAGLTIAAVGLAAALGVQSSCVIESFRGEILMWVRCSIVGDLFVLSGSSRLAAGRNQPLDGSFVDAIRQVPGVRLARGVRGIFMPFRGDTVYVVGFDAAAYEGFTSMPWREGESDKSKESILRDTGVLVSDNLARIHGFAAGQEIELPGQQGPVPVTVAGVVTDYSWGRGSILMNRSLFSRLFNTDAIDLVAISVDAGVDVESVRTDLLDRWRVSHRLVVSDAGAFRSMVIDELSAAFSFASAQQLAVLAIAFLAVLNTVTLSLMSRRRELRLLSAVGATPSQLRRSAVLEGSFLAVFGTVLGLVVGLVITRLLMRDLLLEASGWSLPVTIPWPLLTLLVLGAALIGAVAGATGLRAALRDRGLRQEL